MSEFWNANAAAHRALRHGWVYDGAGIAGAYYTHPNAKGSLYVGWDGKVEYLPF